jgi:hypothetical protein
MIMNQMCLFVSKWQHVCFEIAGDSSGCAVKFSGHKDPGSHGCIYGQQKALDFSHPGLESRQCKN